MLKFFAIFFAYIFLFVTCLTTLFLLSFDTDALNFNSQMY